MDPKRFLNRSWSSTDPKEAEFRRPPWAVGAFPDANLDVKNPIPAGWGATTSSSDSSSKQRMQLNKQNFLVKNPGVGYGLRARNKAGRSSLIDPHPAKGIVTREEKDRIGMM